MHISPATAPRIPNFCSANIRPSSSLNISDLEALCIQSICRAQEERMRFDAMISVLCRKRQEQQTQLIHQEYFRQSHAHSMQQGFSSSLNNDNQSPGSLLQYESERDLLNRLLGHSSQLQHPPDLTNYLPLATDFYRIQNRSFSLSQAQQASAHPVIGSLHIEGPTAAEPSDGEQEGLMSMVHRQQSERRTIEANVPHFAQETHGRNFASTQTEDTTRGAATAADSRKSEEKSVAARSSGLLGKHHQKKRGYNNASPPAQRHERRKYDSESFAVKVFRMCTDQEALGMRDTVEFLDGGGGFWLHDPKRMVSDLMPRYFRGRTYASFRRQLISYGFRKSINISNEKTYGAFLNPFFCRGRPELCKQILRDNRYDRGIKTPTYNQDSEGCLGS